MKLNKKLVLLFILLITTFLAYSDYYSEGDVSVSVKYNNKALIIENDCGKKLTNIKLMLNGRYIFKFKALNINESKKILYSDFSKAPNKLTFYSLTLVCDEGTYDPVKFSV